LLIVPKKEIVNVKKKMEKMEGAKPSWRGLAPCKQAWVLAKMDIFREFDLVMLRTLRTGSERNRSRS
jgi:hypothetical protein